ncbi:MAG: hypothetical protein Q9228_002608 [Teloschistes exilis]
MGKDSSTLLCMLNLQEIQLTDWARCADTDKLKTRYKLSLSDRPPKGASIRSPPEHGILGSVISWETRNDILLTARLVQSRNRFPQRLWWAAVDKSKFEEYVSQIRFFVQELWRLLDPLRQDEMAAGFQMVLSHVIGMSNKIVDLKSLQDTLSQTSNPHTEPTHQSCYPALASVAEIKAVTLSMDAALHEQSLNFPRTADDGKLATTLTVHLLGHLLSDFIALKSNPEMGVAQYDGSTVFIEWKTLPVDRRQKVMAMVEDLARLLSAPKHPSFRSLRCRGLARYMEDSKAAFVFDLPDPHETQPPRPLRTLFGSISPSVTDRLQLALQITESLRCFHTAGWLHKDLRSQNILLFPFAEAATSSIYSLTRPTLAGFAYSRVESSPEVSERPSADPHREIYRHPDAMGDPAMSFTAVKDIYALGTVLLEIGEWRSLKSLVAKIVDVEKANVGLTEVSRVRPFLLDGGPKGGLATLKFRMGDIYTSVTKMMLSGELPEQPAVTKESGEIFLSNILDVAVQELSRCLI